MENLPTKTIGIALIDGYADWEFGFLSGGAVEHMGAKVVFLSPDGKVVRSIGGLSAKPDRGIGVEENMDLDALALIGSDGWPSQSAPDLAPLVSNVLARGGVVGGICAATVPLAKGGFFEGRRHTSNGREWIANIAGNYAGASQYSDVPDAVSDGRVVSAPGTAPVSFAMAFLLAIYPQAGEMLAGARAMFGAEHSG